MQNTLTIPQNIKTILEKDMLSWSYEEMQAFSNWQQETDSYPGLMEENKGPQELPCFWEQRGITSHCR